MEDQTEMEVRSVKALVTGLMETDERCRNDDKWLTFRVFEEIAKQHGKKIYIPFEIFGFFPAFETVKRVRAHIQNVEGRLQPTRQDVIEKRQHRQEIIPRALSDDYET